MDWYAIFVETGSEDVVKKCLELQFCQKDLYSCVPKRIIPEKKGGGFYNVVKTLFPGYLLIKTKMTPAIYYELKKLPKYYRLLRNSSFVLDKIHRRSHRLPDLRLEEQEGNCSYNYDVFFNKIDEEEIRQILQLTNNDNIIEYSNVIVEDSKVYVQSGPLYGLEGMIKKIDKRKRRAKIAMNLFGEGRLIEVGIELMQDSRR